MAATTLTPTLDRQVRDLRQSSRLLVRVLGVMRNRVDGIGCTPAQCHVLIELGAHGRLRTADLAGLLQIDKSTASRSVSQLLQQGFLEAESDPSDLRSKPVHLTDAGRELVERIHAEADEQVHSALLSLTEEERRAILRGVALYEKALHRSRGLAGVTVRPMEAGDDRAVSSIIRDVMIEHGATGSGTSSKDAELEAMFEAYSGSRCAYFVAERDGQLLAGGGIAALRGHDGDDVCELRKMHALPAARGLGVGRLLLERCLSEARELKYRLCYLESLRSLQRARVLYEKFGFQPLDGPMGDTGHHACDCWYALEL
jgi:putative acetyltransferase